jgi:hypothetical protein
MSEKCDEKALKNFKRKESKKRSGVVVNREDGRKEHEREESTKNGEKGS